MLGQVSQGTTPGPDGLLSTHCIGTAVPGAVPPYRPVNLGQVYGRRDGRNLAAEATFTECSEVY